MWSRRCRIFRLPLRRIHPTRRFKRTQTQAADTPSSWAILRTVCGARQVAPKRRASKVRSCSGIPERLDRPLATPAVCLELRQPFAIQVPQQTNSGVLEQVT